MPEWLAAHRAAAAGEGAKAFSVDPARVRFLDLRAVATVSYGDAVADDGKGGWTDEGPNCMENAPWGVTDCNGVPFDFIRPDQNGDRAAVVLRSARQPWLPDAARDIAVGARVEALWFLHAGAFVEPGAEAFRYVVRYADGSSVALPMRGYVEFDDWWPHGPGRGGVRSVPGWLNAKNRGFHVWRWENPFPERTVATLDIESAVTRTAPIVEAVTAELARGDLRVATPFDGAPKASAWGGAKIVSHAESAELDFSGSRPWAGGTFSWPSSFTVPADAARADLEFLVSTTNGLPLPPLQAKVGDDGHYAPLEPLLRETGMDGVWLAAVPADLAKGELHAPFSSVSLQLQGKRPEGTSDEVHVGTFRVVMRGEPESPLSLRRIEADGRHGVRAVRRDGGIELAVDDKTEAWGYARLKFVRPVAIPADPATTVLAFDANGGRTPLGRRDRGRQRFRVRATCALADGTEADGEWTRDPPIDGGRVDEDPWSWQTVRVPLKGLFPPGAAAIQDLRIQFTGLPDGAERAGLLVRNFRFEPETP